MTNLPHRIYGHMHRPAGLVRVSIDGSTPRPLDYSRTLHDDDLVQRMIWSSTSLDPGRHTLNITYDEANIYVGVYLDFFR